jgi:hypothetical protein
MKAMQLKSPASKYSTNINSQRGVIKSNRLANSPIPEKMGALRETRTNALNATKPEPVDRVKTTLYEMLISKQIHLDKAKIDRFGTSQINRKTGATPKLQTPELGSVTKEKTAIITPIKQSREKKTKAFPKKSTTSRYTFDSLEKKNEVTTKPIIDLSEHNLTGTKARKSRKERVLSKTAFSSPNNDLKGVGQGIVLGHQVVNEF